MSKLSVPNITLSLVTGGRESALKMGNFIFSRMCDIVMYNRIKKKKKTNYLHQNLTNTNDYPYITFFELIYGLLNEYRGSQ
jgi:hypothetical protein